MSDTEHDEQPEPISGEPLPDDDDEQGEADESTPTPEPEPEPEPQANAGPQSEKEIERALKQLEGAGTTYRNRVSKIMGETAQNLEPCPRCNAPVAGLIFPPDVAPVDDDTRAAVLASVGEGEAAAPPLREAEGVKMCDRCDGHGQLRYPTRNVHVQTQQCPRCAGQGYVSVDQPASNIVTFAPIEPITAPNVTMTNGPCPLCGTPGMAGQSHWCNPASAAGA